MRHVVIKTFEGDTHKYTNAQTDLITQGFDLICDLLLNCCTTTWNQFFK